MCNQSSVAHLMESAQEEQSIEFYARLDVALDKIDAAPVLLGSFEGRDFYARPTVIVDSCWCNSYTWFIHGLDESGSTFDRQSKENIEHKTGVLGCAYDS